MSDASVRRFMEEVGAEFDAAGVNYAILHEGGDGQDSDLDIAVGHESLETVDWIIRTGTFGRLIQRFDYDVPWCRFYVVFLLDSFPWACPEVRTFGYTLCT